MLNCICWAIETSLGKEGAQDFGEIEYSVDLDQIDLECFDLLTDREDQPIRYCKELAQLAVQYQKDENVVHYYNIANHFSETREQFLSLIALKDF